jgi:hypothetical protein
MHSTCTAHAQHMHSTCTAHAQHMHSSIAPFPRRAVKFLDNLNNTEED